MKNKIIKACLLPLVAILSSCGFGLKEVYAGDAYASGNFQKDYYKVWDEKIDKTSGKSRIKRTEEYELNKDIDYVFTSYTDPNFRLVDSEAYKNLSYKDDYYPGDSDYYLNTGYGPTKKMSRIDNSFKYGYLSKLFDGQMMCHSRFQYARVQIDESGFGTIFNKEGNLSTYFALNFKASYDYTKYEEVDYSPWGTTNIPNGIKTGVKLKISFYCIEDDGFVEKTFSYDMDDITTNGMENPSIYTFFGFRTYTYDLTRVKGVSITFDFDRSDINKNPMRDLKDKNGNPYKLDYSLMLYEMFMPDTIWR